MKRKVTTAVLILFLILSSAIYGMMSVRRDNWLYHAYANLYQLKRTLFLEEVEQKGIWGKQRNSGGDLSEEQRKAMSKVSSLPYLQGYNSAPDMVNVTIYDEDRAQNGLNFVVSAHGPKAFVMDMNGNILHQWSREFTDVWSETYQVNVPQVYRTYWRRAQLLPNGDLLAQFMNYGLLKLNKDSEVIWDYKSRVHHDLFVAENDNIYILDRELIVHKGLMLENSPVIDKVLADNIMVLSPDGKFLKKISVVDCFLNSEYAPHLEHIKAPFDILHSNTIRAIDGRLAGQYPMFKKGHILISMREIHTIAVIDPEAEKVTWALTGKWKYQHEPRLLSNGNILLFDNRGNHGKSKAVEINPYTQEIVWSYGSGDDFYSREAGSLERLANGNTLITESEYGRAFEVTSEGEIVWEFFNPFRAGENDELIASLYDVIRVDKEDLDWLDKK